MELVAMNHFLSLSLIAIIKYGLCKSFYALKMHQDQLINLASHHFGSIFTANFSVNLSDIPNHLGGLTFELRGAI